MQDTFLIWLKRELKLRGLSMRTVAKKADFSPSYVSDVLSGKKPVTLNFCASIANALNEPVWKLATMAGLLEKIPEEINNDETTRALVKSFYELPIEGQKEVIEYIKWVSVKYKKNL